jgi:sugar lactone lactonase YvrE
MAITTIAAQAQGTHLWTQSRLEEFEKGTPQGVALTSDGHLREGPSLTELATTPSTYVWSVAVDKSGTAYVGTASPATVLRIAPDGKVFTLFESKDLSVQVVRLGPDGALYAATLPSGKVFRLKTDATAKQDEASAELIFDAAKLDDATAAEGTATGKSADGKDSGKASDSKASDANPTGDKVKSPEKPAAKSHYIWEMTFDAAGRLYIATGGPGAIYRVDVSKSGAKPEVFFKSDEQHIRSLAWDAQGNWIAGTDGSGLVYRISPEGKGYVLFEAPRREITAVAVAANGTIYAACVGDKSRNPLPPLTLQGPGMGAMVTFMQPGSMQAANTSASVPEGSEIYALAEGQAPRKLWAGKDDIVYALAAQAEGLLVLTGNRGRVFRIADDGSYADIAHLAAQQGLSLAVEQGAKGQQESLLIATGNTGKLFTLRPSAGKHEYASDVLDAGALARFGRVEVQPGSSNYELLTRTGNVEQPARGRNGEIRADWGWSDWLPLHDGVVASPAGRFLQWKAVLRPNGTIGSVGVNYLPINAAPVVDELVVVPGARWNGQNQLAGQPPMVSIAFPAASPNAGPNSSPNVGPNFGLNAGQNAAMSHDAGANAPLQAAKDRTAITVRWAAHDDNGDELTYSLYLRGDGETIWRLIKDKILDKAYSFDATLIPDGGYQIKVVASDAPSHTPGEALTGDRISERFEVDTTPPVISAFKATGEHVDCEGSHCPRPFRVVFDAEDAFSPIVRAEYSLDAGPWQYIEPVGRISDSKREHYELRIFLDVVAGKISEHLITVRVYDRHDNAGVAKTVIAAEEK